MKEPAQRAAFHTMENIATIAATCFLCWWFDSGWPVLFMAWALPRDLKE